MPEKTQVFSSCTFQHLPDEAVRHSGSPCDFEIQRLELPGNWGGSEAGEAAARILRALQQHGGWAALAVDSLIQGWQEEAGHCGTYVPARTVLEYYDGHETLKAAITWLVGWGLLEEFTQNGRRLVWPTAKFVKQLEPIRIRHA